MAFLAFCWLGNKPALHRGKTLLDLPNFIGSFVHQMSDGSLLFLEPDGTDFFLQFKLLRVARASSRIEFAFPNAPWSRQYFKAVHGLLVEAGHSPDTVSTNSREQSETTEFIIIRFAGNRNSLEQQALTIATATFEALGLPLDHPFTAHYEGSLHPVRSRRPYTPNGSQDAA